MSDLAGIAGLVQDFGPSTLFVAFLIWDRTNMRKERIEADKERTEADKLLAGSLSALSTAIQTLQALVMRDRD